MNGLGWAFLAGLWFILYSLFGMALALDSDRHIMPWLGGTVLLLLMAAIRSGILFSFPWSQYF